MGEMVQTTTQEEAGPTASGVGTRTATFACALDMHAQRNPSRDCGRLGHTNAQLVSACPTSPPINALPPPSFPFHQTPAAHVLRWHHQTPPSPMPSSSSLPSAFSSPGPPGTPGGRAPTPRSTAGATLPAPWVTSCPLCLSLSLRQYVWRVLWLYCCCLCVNGRWSVWVWQPL